MADSGTAGPGPSDSALAGSTFHLEVSTLAGGCLTTIPDAQRSWQLGDVLSRLPDVLPGHRYELLRGEAVLAAGTAIAEWAQPVDGRACVTAVVVASQTQEKQWQLDMALLRAAGALDVEKVRELLSAGADARFRSPVPKVTTALHAAIEARGPCRQGDGEDEERDKVEQEGRLEAVLRALLSARADADAARRELCRSGATSSACALHSAVQRGSLGAVRILLDARANINAVAKLHGNIEMDRDTALHLATQAGNLPLAALLLERGAGVNITREYFELDFGKLDLVPVRETALHMAVVGGHQALVALLVQAGADATIPRSHDGQETSLEEFCAGEPGMLDAIRADSSAALLASGDFGPEVEAALAAFAARRAAA